MANIGVVRNANPTTALSNATVDIILGAGEGDNLLASCVAEFDLQTGATPMNKPIEVLVAFPVTGMNARAVKVDLFAVLIDEIQKPSIMNGWVAFDQRDPSASPTYMIGGPAPADGENSDSLNEAFHTGSRIYQAFIWNQAFRPDSHCHVRVSYNLELFPQSLAYEKRSMHGQDMDLVPFDAMVAGDSKERAYFFDYILRSGATWLGPIGHETITLRTDETLAFSETGAFISGDLSGLPLPGEIYAVQHKSFSDGGDDFHEALKYVRVGVDLRGFTPIKNGIVWTVDHQKPTSDILLEIPLRAIKRVKPHLPAPPPQTTTVGSPG